MIESQRRDEQLGAKIFSYSTNYIGGHTGNLDESRSCHGLQNFTLRLALSRCETKGFRDGEVGIDLSESCANLYSQRESNLFRCGLIIIL